jgi:carotenoid cleavage dioxygenase
MVGYVYDAATDRSDLVVLDASNIAAPPVAVVHLPVRVPLGFHGNWIADDAARTS